MTNPLTWSVCLDVDRDFTFDNGIDNITAYVTAMNWNNGFASPTADVTVYDDIAPPSRLTLTLMNDGKQFAPETLGSELVANGGFTNWTSDNPNSWTVTGESGTDPQVSQVAPDHTHGGGGTGACNIYSTSATCSIKQTILTAGTSYRVTLRVTGGISGAGGLRIYCGTTQQVGYLIQQPGDYTFYFNASSTSIKFETYLACDLTMDDISVKATSLYGRLINPGSLIRVRAVYSGTTYALYYGRVAKGNGIAYSALGSGQGGTTGASASQVTLTIEDDMTALLDAEYTPPLLTNCTVDTAITRMFDDSITRWPYGDYGTLLDVPGTNVLGLTARLYGYTQTILNLETGITQFDYLGEMSDKGHGVSAQGYLRDIFPGEGGGRLWCDARTHAYTFHNRHHDALNNTIAATYTQDNFIDMKYTYADNLTNSVTINYTTRTIGAENSVVYVNKSVPIHLRAGDERVINARYIDPSNDKVRIGVQTGTPVAPNVDYIANSSETGAGRDLSRRVYVGVEFGATSAKITLRNNNIPSLYITYLQLRATPFLWQTDTLTKEDGLSISQYGRRPMPPKSIRATVSDEFVRLLADDWLRKFKQPLALIQSVTFNALDNPLMAMARVIGDKITITDTFTGHNGDYIIVGEQHQVSQAGYTYTVTWTLKPALRESIFIIGVTGKDELNSANVLGL